MFSVPDHLDSTHHRAHNSTRSTASHVQLITELYLYKLRIFNKIEVSRLDSTFFIIIFILHTLSWCQISGKNSDCLQDHMNRTLNAERFFYRDLNSLLNTAFQEDLKYSDFFRDHLPQHIGDVRREFIFYGLEWDLESRHRSTCTTELNIYKGMKEFKNIGNLRHFYFFQDHTTTDQQNGERQT